MISLIVNNWVGLVIGIVVAALLCLVLGFTLFKNNKIAGAIISIVLIVAFAFAGMAMQNTFFQKETSGYIEPNPDIYDDSIEYLEPNKYTHITSETGFDRSYVEKNRPLAELCEDKFANLKMVEFKDCVVFSYDIVIDNVTYVPNIIMTKAKNTLVFDGCFNIILLYKAGKIKLFSERDVTFAPTSDMLKTNPIQYTEFWRGDNFTYKNFESHPNNGYRFPFTAGPVLPRYFCMTQEVDVNALIGTDIWSSLNPGSNMKNSCYKCAQQFVYRLRETLFQQIGDLTMMLSATETSNSMDAVYNDMYTAVKGKTTGTYNLNVTDHFYYYGKKTVDEKTEYVLYNNKNFVSLAYTNRADTNCFKSDSYDKDKKAKADAHISVTPITLDIVPQITFKLNNKNKRDVTSYDPSVAPVTITLTNKEDTTVKYTYIINTQSSFYNGMKTGIKKGNYSVTIESKLLDIGQVADITIDKDKTVLIDFDYQYGTILASVQLRPLSNFDFSNLDLTANPVTITFNNKTSSYNFVFSDITKINEPITKRVPLGTYNWAIISNELSFDKTSGETTITLERYQMVFNYDYKTNVEYELQGHSVTHSISKPDTLSVVLTNYAFNVDSLSFSDIVSVMFFGTVNDTEFYSSAMTKKDDSYVVSFEYEYDSNFVFQLVIKFDDGTIITTSPSLYTYKWYNASSGAFSSYGASEVYYLISK